MAIIRLIIRPRDSANPGAGFRASLDFGTGDIEDAFLPAMPPELKKALTDWQAAYSSQEGVRSHYRLSIVDPPIIKPVRDVIDLSHTLKTEFERWLRSPDHHRWQEIRETLISLSNRPDPRLILDLGQDNDLKRLPWQDWDLFTRHNFQTADAALRSVSDLGTIMLPGGSAYPRAEKIRILVIVGESTGIQTSQDLSVIQALADNDPNRVEVISLIQPTPKDLQTALSDSTGYHILVYVGHSKSSQNGQIGWLLLNEHDELSVGDFKFALKKVVQRGLQLAIFNSCDSLGLAQQLAQLDAPRCIVMKEPVPDKVAVEFIEHFFQQFVQNQEPLLRAVRLARQELEHVGIQHSEVTWLPTVCVKQNAPSLTWQDLLDHLIPSPPTPPSTPPTPPPSTPPTPPPPTRKILLAAAVLGALLLGGVGLMRLLKSDKPPLPDPIPVSDASNLLSAGEKPIEGASAIALSSQFAAEKQRGIEAFARGDYASARDIFAKIRSDAKLQRSTSTAANEAVKDPTILIYQNNAEVRLRHQNGQPVYTIAAAVPLNINVGQQMLFGIAQAQDQAVNQDNPINLEIVIANDGNDPNQAKAVAKSLTEASFDGRSVLAVVGHYTSDSSCEALKAYYAPAQVVLLSPLSTLTDLRKNCGDSNLFFRTTSSAKIEARTLVEYLKKQSPSPRPRVAIFYNPTDQFSTDLYQQFKTALGNPDNLTTYDLSTPINIQQVLEQSSTMDALAVFPDGRSRNRDAFNRALEIIEASGGQQLILGSNPLYDLEVIREGGGAKLRNQLIVATDWYWTCAPNNPDGFVKQVEEVYWFGQVNRTTALSYEAIQALQATLKPGVQRPEIQQQLADLNGVKSLTFKDKDISFDGNGDRRELDKRLLTTPGNGQFDLVAPAPSFCQTSP